MLGSLRQRGSRTACTTSAKSQNVVHFLNLRRSASSAIGQNEKKNIYETKRNPINITYNHELVGERLCKVVPRQ